MANRVGSGTIATRKALDEHPSMGGLKTLP
jgi:hypothetical protein